MGDVNRVIEIDKVHPDLKKSLYKIAKNEEFILFDMIVKSLISDGNNYIGTLSEAIIKGTTRGGDAQINIFVKTQLPDKDNLEIVSIQEAYDREIYAYMEIAKFYEEFQENAQIPPEERYKFAKCYEQSTSELILIENLSMKGFTTPNRFEVISLDFAEICIKQLAKFHAISYAIEINRPNYFNEKIKVLKFPYRFNEQWDIFFSKASKTSLSYLEGRARDKLEQALPELTDKFIRKFTKNVYQYLSLCHGDYRTSNILQKKQNDKVTEVMPVDYQMLHYGMPMQDLMVFIFGATDSEFRRNHLDYLKNLYFDTIAEFLMYFSIDIENVFPKNEFESIYREHLDFGLFFSLWYFHFHLADEDDLPDLTKISSMKLSSSNQRIKSRLVDVVNDFIDWGYL